MHELSICRAIVKTVNEHAGGTRVRQVSLRIGHFRQIVPETLEFCWQMSTIDSELAGATLHITPIPAVVDCADCNTSSTLTEPILVCQSCDSRNVTMVSGDDFLVESIDLVPAATAFEEIP